MKDRKKPEKFLLPHGMPSDDRECAFSSRVPPKTLKIKAPYKSWHYQFSADLSDLAPPGSQYTHRVIDLAVRLVVEDGVPYRPASWHLWRAHRVFVPFAAIQNWVEAGGKKGAGAHGHRVP